MDCLNSVLGCIYLFSADCSRCILERLCCCYGNKCCLETNEKVYFDRILASSSSMKKIEAVLCVSFSFKKHTTAKTTVASLLKKKMLQCGFEEMSKPDAT